MLKNKKILVTAVTGNIGIPLAANLAKDNETWGFARFSDPAKRKWLDDRGVITRSLDQNSAEYGDLPDDFDYVVHLGATVGSEPDYDGMIAVNAEGTGLLMRHCRKAKGFLVMTTTSVYKPQDDPMRPYLETDPLGDANVPGAPCYSIAKITSEAAARTCARLFDLPTIIVRMNAAYGTTGVSGLPGMHLDMILNEQPVYVRNDPAPYIPISDQDIVEQLGPILEAASVPATIINWGGDIPVSTQQWCAYFGELLGIEPEVILREVPNSQRGMILDNTKRMALTGPCKVHWKDGFKELLKYQLETRKAAGTLKPKFEAALARL